MKTMDLCGDWQFYLGDFPSVNDWNACDDKVTVSVPHDWGTMYPIDENNLTGKGGGYAVAGIAWYQKKITLTQEDCAQYIRLRFGSVYQNASVYVNGTFVAQNAYGYTSFNLDISAFVQAGENVIDVRVDNSEQPNSRWYSGSGILQAVTIEILHPVHLTPWPVYVKTVNIDYKELLSHLEVHTSVENKTEKPVTTTVVHQLFDATGAEVSMCSANIKLAPDEMDEAVVMPKVLDSILWSAKSPYLYTLKSTLLLDDQEIQVQETKVGIRKITFDCDKGFLINEQHEKIKGMCIHHDCGMTGGVGYQETLRMRLEKLKDMGCNGIRCAHNPPSIDLLDLCDELGFYVMDEAFDEWQLGKVKHHAIKYSTTATYGYNLMFGKDAEKDLVTMLHRDRNHPSIVLWSIGNEILEQTLEHGYKIVQQLSDICHREDPTRMVTSGCDKIVAPMKYSGAFRSFEEALDVVGYNYVDRWGDRGELLYDIDRQLYPKRIMIGSENYSCGMIRGDYSTNHPIEGFNRTKDYRHSTLQNQHLWRAVGSKDYIAGDFLWTGVDYLGESFWPARGGNCAPIDCCAFEKDTFYYFRSIWNQDAITLHVAPHWNFPDEVGQYRSVIVYTNCKQVDLYLNGKFISSRGYEFPRRGRVNHPSELMSKAVQSTNDFHLNFDVMYEPGELVAVGFDDDMNEVARTVVKTTGAPKALVAKAVNTEGKVHIAVSTVDENGLEVPNATNMVHCEVLGGGKLIAMDNGDMLDHTVYATPDRNLFAGKLLALVDKQGDLVVQFTAEGLEPVKIAL